MEPSQGMTRYSVRTILEIIFRRWFWLAVFAVIFAVGISALYWFQYFSTYRVFATFIPAVQAEAAVPGSYSVVMSQSFIKHEEVLQAVAKSVSFDVSYGELDQAISADINESGVAVTVRVEWDNMAQAYEILEALKANLSFAITHSAKAGTIKWLDSAASPSGSLGASRVQIYMVFLLGALAGVVAGAVLSFFIGSFDKQIYDLRRVSYNGDVRVIGFVSRYDTKQGKTDGHRQQVTAIALYLKMLMESQDQQLIMCISPTGQCGTSTVIFDIAQVLAGMQLKVLIVTIQTSARRALLSESAIVPVSPGVDRGVFAWDDKESNPDFDGPLSSTLAMATKKYALVLVDCPPLLTNIQMSGLAVGMDTTLLVCGYGITRQEDVDAAVSLLSRAEAKPIYCVWNFVDKQYDNTYLPVETAQEQREGTDDAKSIGADVHI